MSAVLLERPCPRCGVRDGWKPTPIRDVVTQSQWRCGSCDFLLITDSSDDAL